MEWSEISSEIGIQRRLWQDAVQERRYAAALVHSAMLQQLANEAHSISLKDYRDHKDATSLGHQSRA